MLTTRSKIALARTVQAPLLAALRCLGRGPRVCVQRRHVRWDLDLEEGIDFAIFLLGAFEPATARALARLVQSGMTVIDIGANIGAHTLPLARLVGPLGRVLACEPTDFAVAKLLRNLALNPALRERVAVHQVMLGADDTVTVPESIPARWPLAGGADVHPKLRGRAMPTKGATASTLDRVLEACGIAKVDVIKLDVDGYECAVLDGAKKTLRQSRPKILMELSPYVLEERGGSVERLTTLFEETGYHLFHLDGKQTLPRAPAEVRRCVADGASRNIISRALLKPRCRKKSGAR